MNQIDLHIHSAISLDGEIDPQMIVDRAKQQKMKYIGIADHNSTQAYQHISDTSGICLIPSVEMDCYFQGLIFHVLLYFVNPNNEVFESLSEKIRKMEKEAGLKTLKYVQEKMNLVVDFKLLNQIHPEGIYTGEGICEACLANTINKNNSYLKEHYAGGKHSVSPHVDFYWEYCSQGKIAYSPIEYMSMESLICLAKKEQATVVLAHPGNNVKEDLELLNKIIALGIDGIEVYSSYHSKQQIQFYRSYAIKYQLLMTCGSDFHGKHKPHIQIGQCDMPQEDEEILIKWLEDKIKSL